MSASDRRGFLRGLVSLPLIGGGVTLVGAAAAIADDHPDAALLRLGEQIEPLYQAKLALRPEYFAKAAAFDEQDDRPVVFLSQAERDAYWARFVRTRKETGFEDVSDRMEAIEQTFDPLARQILDMPAKTPLGVAVKARVLMFDAFELWDEPLKELDYDKEQVRRLVEAVCAVAGLSVPSETA